MRGKARKTDTGPEAKRRGGDHLRPTREAAPRGRWWTRLFLLSVFAVLVLLGVTIARRIPITHRFYTDAESIREPAGAAQTRDILWQSPKKLAELTGTTFDGYEPRLSADGLTLFFVRGKAGDNANIYVSLRTPVTSKPRASARATTREQSLLTLALRSDHWSEPEPLDGVNSDYDDLGPEPSPDGRSVYFYSDRPGGSGGYDLWVAHRSNTGWQDPINLGRSVNSEFNDYRPALTPDGLTLYFSSNRPEPQASARADAPDSGSQPDASDEITHRRNYDLYSAVVTDRGVEKAAPVTILNTPHNDGAPAVSAFGDFLYFVSDRPGGEGGYDLYRSRRVHGKHLPAENVGATVNTRFDELDPTVGLGGYTLYFSSDRWSQRPEAQAEAGARGDEPIQEHKYDLCYTISREVFSELERIYRPAIDWAALWSKIAPNLLWALFALLLSLALLALMRDAHARRLSLIAKCLLASLTAHLLLMLVFNVWQVTTTLAHELRRRGPVRVALNSTSTSDALAGQIRGRLTDVTSPAPPAISTPRQETSAEIQAVAAIATLTVDRHPSDMPDESTADVSADDASVVQRIERPRPAHTLADAPMPMRFETALPTQPHRVDVAEVDSAEPPSRELQSAQNRPSTNNIRSPSQSVTVEVAPSPSTRATSTALSARSSMADPLALREATTQAPTSLVNQAERSTAYSDRPSSPALALSSLPAQRLPETDEITARVAGQATAPHRAAGFSPRVLDTFDEPAARALHLGPTVIGAPSDDSTLAETPTTRDTLPGSSFASAEDQAALAQDFSQLPLAELSLAAPDTSSPAPLTDGTPRDDLQSARNLTGTVARRSLPTGVTSARSGETPKAFDPETTASSADRHSLAAALQPEVTAAPERRMAREGLAGTEATAALPSLMDIALPSLEQSATAPQTESRLRATATAANLPRAPLAGTLSHGEISVFATTLNVTALPHAESAEPFTDGPDHAGDLDTERPELLAALAAPAAPEISIPELDVPKLSLPVEEEQQPTTPYARRRAPDRMEIVERGGGSEETERAVADALGWLAKHQSDDGRWDGDGFDQGCGRCGGETNIVVDHALTGLALLAFLGAGHTHVDDGPYKHSVERGLQWLLGRQAADGDLRGDETMYSHAIAAIALSEAYGMTGEQRLADPVQRAILFIDRARNVRVGGWRYDPGQAGDTSVLGWQVMALKSASMNRISVPAGSFKAAREWLDTVCSRSPRGLYAYRPGRPHTPAMTAESMFTQQLLGLPREDPRMQVASEYISQHAPNWESQVNTYFWYYATLALFQHQGSRWLEWNERLTDQLLTHQRKDGRAAGSWDPEGEWADIGGRIYQTTLCTLMLEVYYRYLPLYSLEETPVDLVGAIRGLVTDATTGLAIPGATVRLDMPDRSLVSAQTARDGSYLLLAPEVPDHFALSAFAEGYVPSSANVASAEVKGTTLTLDFELDPQSRDLVAIESTPGVHHLGDDNFDGRINSQFQKKSEGSVYTASFELRPMQVPPHVRAAEVRLLAKGVQRSHKIRINGTVLEERLDDAPSDGSFGEFVASFDPSLLAAGTNTFEIIAKPSRTDIDDFEFVNVRIWLQP